jgi:cytoskeletal protein RodZ
MVSPLLGVLVLVVVAVGLGVVGVWLVVLTAEFAQPFKKKALPKAAEP